MKKVVITLSVIFLLITVFLFYNTYKSRYIVFGFEDGSAGSITTDDNFQMLPQWEYTILKDGSVYYRETEGYSTHSRFEYHLKKFICNFEYKYIKKLDKDSLNQMVGYINEQKKASDRNTSSIDSSNYSQEIFLNSWNRIKIKEGFKWIELTGTARVNYLKELVNK